MCRLKCISDLRSDFNNRRRIQGAAIDLVDKRLPFDKLHRHETNSPAFTDIVDRRNVWMVESRGGFGLTYEPLDPACIRRDIGRQDLKGGDAVKSRISNSIDLAHPTRADQREHSVVTDGGS